MCVVGKFSEKAKIRYEITVENSSPLLLNAFTKERDQRENTDDESREASERKREREGGPGVQRSLLREREREREVQTHASNCTTG